MAFTAVALLMQALVEVQQGQIGIAVVLTGHSGLSAQVT